MFYVPLYLEGIRSRPVLVVWLATLAQAALWLAVPMLFYAAPPGDLAQVLAIGHEFQFGSDVGLPFAFWLAEIAFRLAGLFGVYALAQICVITTYWCVFKLGSAIVGPAHAAVAVLLMAGISLFTVPTPDFGPPILTMALWAFVLLHYWRAVMQGHRRSWYAAGCAAALILLTSEAALILLGALALFTAVTERGRAALGAIEPWIVAVALVSFLFLHLLWLEGAGDGLTSTLARLRISAIAGRNTLAWLRLLSALILAHAGLAILVVLASGWPRVLAAPMPAIARGAVDAFAKTFVKVFALVPALLATIFAVAIGRPLPIGGAAPLVVLSGLAVIVAAGDSIVLYHQRIVGFAWAGLLIVPAILVPVVMVLLPWTTGTDLKVAQPAAAMGRFFADSFASRTGRPLAVVSGDVRTAALVALAAPSRPSVYFDGDPERSPAVTADDIRKKGAVVVWLTADTTPTPPPQIKAYFPDLIPEVPQAFERSVQGRLPLLRVGWGVIRPASTPAAAAAH
jgi:Dolichyl-phosphate-mannose-protein mannosyltransferase